MPILDDVLLKPISSDPLARTPLYAQVRNTLSLLIDSQFENGQRFYSAKYLAATLAVSQITIRRALHELESEGLLEKSQGKVPVVRKRVSGLVRAAHVAPSKFGHAPSAQPDERPSGLIALGVFRPERVHMTSEYSMQMLDRVHDECEQRRLDLRYYDSSTIEKLGRAFNAIEMGPSEMGFLLFTNVLTTPLLYHAMNDRGYRTVSMEGAPDDYPGSIVETDARMAVQLGLQHLRSLGHERITLLVNEPGVERSVQDKVRSFQDYVAEEGIAEQCRVIECRTEQGNAYEAAMEAAPRLFEGAERPTAIFTVSDPGAWAVLKWCHQQGLAVPDDISVIGFEDARSSQYMHPALTTVAHPIAQLARAVLDVLCGSSPGGVQQLKIAPHLVIRESTGPASTQRAP